MSKLRGSIRVYDNINLSILTEILGTSLVFREVSFTIICYLGESKEELGFRFRFIIFTGVTPKSSLYAC